MVTTIGELLTEFKAFEITRERARRIEEKIKNAPEMGTRDGFYARRSMETYAESRQIMARIDRSPGYSSLKAACEAEYGGVTVERLLQMRGRLATAIRQDLVTINGLALDLFAAEYLKHAASPGLSKLARATESVPLLSVSRWSELAIGLDERKRIWARKPAPDIGGQLDISNSTLLSFGGDQWPALLELFAKSKDGSSARKADVITAFGYMDCSSILPTHRGARSGAIQAEITSELATQLKTAGKQLTRAITTLSQSLREQIDGPKGRGKSALASDGDTVRSGFIVQYLVRDAAGHYFFGQRTS